MDHLTEASGAIGLSGQNSWSVVSVVTMILSEAPHAVALDM